MPWSPKIKCIDELSATHIYYLYCHLILKRIEGWQPEWAIGKFGLKSWKIWFNVEVGSWNLELGAARNMHQNQAVFSVAFFVWEFIFHQKTSILAFHRIWSIIFQTTNNNDRSLNITPLNPNQITPRTKLVISTLSNLALLRFHLGLYVENETRSECFFFVLTSQNVFYEIG